MKTMLTGNAACLAEQEKRREALPSPKHSRTPSVFPLLRELLNLIGDRGIDDVCVGDIDDNGIPVSKKMTTIITQ